MEYKVLDKRYLKIFSLLHAIWAWHCLIDKQSAETLKEIYVGGPLKDTVRNCIRYSTRPGTELGVPKRKKTIESIREGNKLSMWDPVFFKVHLREGKLDRQFEVYFIIVEQTGPLTFVIWDQMLGRVKM